MTIGGKSGSLTNDDTVDVGAIIECRHRLVSVLSVDQLRALGHMIEQRLGQAPNDEALESLDRSSGLRESVHRASRGLSSPNEMRAL